MPAETDKNAAVRSNKPADFLVHEVTPFNSEPPRTALTDDITPLDQLFTRNHHDIPGGDPAEWTLTIDGLVATALQLSYNDILALPQTHVTAVMECAGNHRSTFQANGQPADGLPWAGGAVGNIRWSGVPLRLLFEQAGPHPSVLQVECHAAGASSFARGIEFDKLAADGLLVLAANDQPLPALHGGPLRIVVPGWYGINNVKWVSRLTLLDRESDSAMNQQSYVLYGDDGRTYGKVRALQPKSMFVGIEDGTFLTAGTQALQGYAWADGTPISAVDVSIDDGPWQPALLGDDHGSFAWRRFTFSWQAAAGRHRLRSRAHTADGRMQPLTAPNNRKGYQMYAVITTSVTVG